MKGHRRRKGGGLCTGNHDSFGPATRDMLLPHRRSSRPKSRYILGVQDRGMDLVARQFLTAPQALELHEKIEGGNLPA